MINFRTTFTRHYQFDQMQQYFKHHYKTKFSTINMYEIFNYKKITKIFLIHVTNLLCSKLSKIKLLRMHAYEPIVPLVFKLNRFM